MQDFYFEVSHGSDSEKCFTQGVKNYYEWLFAQSGKILKNNNDNFFYKMLITISWSLRWTLQIAASSFLLSNSPKCKDIPFTSQLRSLNIQLFDVLTENKKKGWIDTDKQDFQSFK